MYNSDTELLFPLRLIPKLKHLRGPSWRNLVKEVLNQPENSAERLSFALMMIRLNNCLGCQPDSYRAMRGCTLCATQNVRRFKGQDNDLLELYRQAQADFQRHAHALNIDSGFIGRKD
jgi:hypothetical protein